MQQSRLTNALDNLARDFRFAVLQLLKNPGFSAIAILTLMVAIGANTAIFTIVNTILIRPLPYQDSEQLALAWLTDLKKPDSKFSVSFPDLDDLRSQTTVFQSISGFDWKEYNLTQAGEPERLMAMAVLPDFFPLLGVNPQMGRGFTSEEESFGKSQVAILNYGLWQRRFGSDQSIINKNITLDNKTYTVIGIMPRGFETSFNMWPSWAGEAPQLFVPLAAPEEERNNRLAGLINLIGRLKPGVRLEQARAELNTIATRLVETYPKIYSGFGLSLVSLRESIVGDIRPTLLISWGVVGIVLLIACANISVLLLSRSTARQRELATRTALGATRSRLISQLITESIVPSLIGGFLGVILAHLAIKSLVALNPESIPRLNEISIDYSVFIFTFGVSLLTAIIFGLLPALHVSKPDLERFLKEGTRGSGTNPHTRRIRGLLVVSEVALTIMLLIGASLMIRSFKVLQDVRPGFNAQNVLTANLTLPGYVYADGNRVSSFYQRLLQQVSSLAGVSSACLVKSLPLEKSNMKSSFTIEGQPPPTEAGWPPIDLNITSPGYFQTLGIKFLDGRDFMENDDAEAPKVAIINKSMVERYLPDENPIGKRMGLRLPGKSVDAMTIIGIVEDVRQRGLATDTQPSIFIPYLQIADRSRSMYLVVKSDQDPAFLSSSVRGAVWYVDSNQPISKMTTMEQLLYNALASRRFSLVLFEIFALVALVLTIGGIYGVISYSVVQRTNEMGIRMALGAQQGDVLRLLLSQGMKLVLIGVSIGLVAAFTLTRFMQALLFQISSTDPIAFVGAAFLFLCAAAVAIYFPARRAMKVDPVVALRYE
jgi:putative ABC transport system permease protein